MAYGRLTNIPVGFSAGSTFRVDITFSSALASEGGSIAIFLRGPGDVDDDDFSYGTNLDAFTIDAAATLTTKWPPGIYNYTIKYTDSGGIVTVAQSGRIEILPDPILESQKDARTFVEIMLDRYRELAKELALNPYKTIQIQDELYSGHDPEKINNLIREYEDRLFRENQAELIRQGKNTQYELAVEFRDV